MARADRCAAIVIAEKEIESRKTGLTSCFEKV
jgi:hypothetical protein